MPRRREPSAEQQATTVDETCPFCRIAQGLEPAHIVEQDEHWLAVLDTRPAAHGHTLVMPRIHVPDLWSAAPETAAALGIGCASVARLIRKRLNPDGLTMRQNNGEASGQAIFHLHVHLVPRWHGDGNIGWPWPPPDSHDPQAILRVLRD